jgi:hypothetical protein
MFKSVYHLNPDACTRVDELMCVTCAQVNDVKKSISAISALATVKPTAARTKLNDLLSTLEKKTVKNNFNFILRNLPRHTSEKFDGFSEPIGYTHVRDTFEQFGDISDLKIVRGTVYIKFTEPTSCVMCHSLVNNMMIGDNIVSTECV